MIVETLAGIKHEEKGLSEESPIVSHVKSYSSQSFVRLHYHDSYEVNLCDNLCGSVHIEGEKFSLEGRKILFLPPGILHSYRINPCQGQIAVWHIGLEYLPLLYSEEVQKFFPQKSYAVTQNEELYNQAVKLCSESLQGDTFQRSSTVLQLLGLFHVQQPLTGESSRNSFLQKIIAWTEKHYSNDISLDMAARAVHLSPFHFSRKFKELSGSTYMEYLTNFRLENSLNFLRKGLSISETAEKSGYGDVSYYIKKFRQCYGTTPLQYQKSFPKISMRWET